MGRWCYASLLFAIGLVHTDRADADARSVLPGARDTELRFVPDRRPHVDKLFRSMRENKYDRNDFPPLTWQDIPSLMELADSDRELTSFPCNPLSSSIQFGGCREGVVALWLVDGIRQGKKFPSLNCYCHKGDTDTRKDGGQIHKELAQAYRAWWKKAEQEGPFRGSQLDPLEGTDLRWH